MKPGSCLFLASCLLAAHLSAQDAQPVAFDPLAADNRTSGPVTMMEVVERDHDFGWVLQDSENEHVFTVKNIGHVPLIITNATGSCGCTVPDYSKDPIQPGETSDILVVYKPGKQEGHQVKTVTLTANTEPDQTLFRIHAEVLKVDPGVPSEPYVFEPLPAPVETPLDRLGRSGGSSDVSAPVGPPTTVLFDAYEHDFGRIPQGSENPHVFKFKNTGDVPLIISNAAGSCGCTVPFFAKDPILPGEESEIHVVYKPGKQEGKQQKTVTITANTEPTATILRIKADVFVVDSVTAPQLFALSEEHEQDRMAIQAVDPGCFVIFPNPTSHELRLDLKEHIGRGADVHIRDEAGREMLHTRINEINSEASRLDVASFAPGIYIATVQVDGTPPMSQCFVVNK